MDLREKITEALRQSLNPEYINLEDDDGISGYVVSSQFRGMSAIDRQMLIERSLREFSTKFTKEELRQVLAIAGLTPAEFEAVGATIRVHRVKEMALGAVEVTIHGRLADAEYVRAALNHQKGVKTTEPKPSAGAVGVLMYFRATGGKENPLTKAKVLDVLRKDPRIEVMPNA